ncbi:MAG: DAK2 domain-containing protein [Anaerolineales bacterium]|nr:DAK2 domain-containing protein [Anaerolineales bacterium]
MSQVLSQISTEQRSEIMEKYVSINAETFLSLTETGLQWLRANQQLVNSLNVFPVPDGDTGTNMLLTMQSAVDETGGETNLTVGGLAKKLAHGALMGARGNSGVILSQLWRGIARALDDLPVMTTADFARALQEARETAYKGVVRPVEGTILTVSTDVAAAANDAISSGVTSLVELLENVVEAADISVQGTPELLPILKEAGVVDSGGKGLYFIFEGMLRYLYNLPVDESQVEVQQLATFSLDETHESIEDGQDWEVVVDFRPSESLDLNNFYTHLETLGTSIQLGEGEGLYRMHIHVPDHTEYAPIDYIHSLGTVTRVAIENLMDQQAQNSGSSGSGKYELAAVSPGSIATIVVAPGKGLGNVFASLGAAAIIEGGQTMNPSTQEILSAFEDLPTDKILILPNNKNILLAARQAAEMTVKSVRVIPTVSVPQGVSAMLSLEPDGDLDELASTMEGLISEVQSGEVTTSTRDVEIDGVQVQKDQVIGLLNEKLVVAGDNVEQVVFKILEDAGTAQAELITLYAGCEYSMKQANALAEKIQEKYPQQEIEVVEGGQPHYQLILSIE